MEESPWKEHREQYILPLEIAFKCTCTRTRAHTHTLHKIFNSIFCSRT